MGLTKSYHRWKSIFLNTKRDRKRIDENRIYLQKTATRGFSKLEHETLDFKTIMSKQEAKVFSQNGEDGLLMYIMNEIGVENYSIVEIGIGDGKECNSRNLIENFGWNAWMIDGSDINVLDAEKFYAKQIEEGSVVIQNSWVTKENIETTIKQLNIPPEIDILSIDIDGNDYWVWESIETISPRVVIIEYNASFGPDKSTAILYDPEFDRFKKHESGYYHGASLMALANLGNKKGYSLICCDTSGSNAIFIQNEILHSVGKLEALSSASAFYPLRKRLESMSLKDQINLIKHLEVVDI